MLIKSGFGVNCNVTLYIRLDFGRRWSCRRYTTRPRFASDYEEDFVKAIIGHSMQAAESERALKEKELSGLLARDKELDSLFERIYEDICYKRGMSNTSNIA